MPWIKRNREAEKRIIEFIPEEPNWIKSIDLLKKAQSKEGFSYSTILRHVDSYVKREMARKDIRGHKDVRYQKTSEGVFFWCLMDVRDKLTKLIEMPREQKRRAKKEVANMKAKAGKKKTIEEKVETLREEYQKTYRKIVLDCMRDLAFLISRHHEEDLPDELREGGIYICVSEKDFMFIPRIQMEKELGNYRPIRFD